MTTQEPVRDPGLDELQRLKQAYEISRIACLASSAGFTPENARERYRKCDAAFTALVSYIEARAVAPWRAALERLFDQTGCDCDSAYLAAQRDEPGWEATEHASDCPVYERWEAVSATARALLHPDTESGG